MAYLVDTSIFGRLANTSDPQHGVAENAVLALKRRGQSLYASPQNMIEFRSIATRPIAVNGLGISASDVEAAIADFEKAFPLLPDIPAIYPAWKTLVQAAGVLGKQVHDARLIAICQVYTVSHILTFNIPHFVRLTGFAPSVAAVHPAEIE